MRALVGVKGLEEADASAALCESIANSGQGLLAGENADAQTSCRVPSPRALSFSASTPLAGPRESNTHSSARWAIFSRVTIGIILELMDYIQYACGAKVISFGS